MKYVLYGFLVAGLAFALSGCGDSGGGYWPGNPVAAPGPTGSGQVQTLGGNAAVAAFNQQFLVSNTAGQSPQAISLINTGLMNGCPMLPVVRMEGSDSDMTYASILPGSRARSYSKGQTGFKNETAAPEGDFTKFEYEYTTSGSINAAVKAAYCSGSHTMVTQSWKFTWWVKFMDAQGNKITPTLNSGSTWFSYASVPDQVQFYGTAVFGIKGTGYDMTLTNTFGNSAYPWIYKYLTSTTQPIHVTGKMNTSVSGTMNDNQLSGYQFGYGIDGGTSACDSFFRIPKQGYPTGRIWAGAEGYGVAYSFNGSAICTIAYSPSTPSGAPTTWNMD